MLHPLDVALIFDLDNTLIHSTIDFRRIRVRLITLLRAAGLSDDSDDALMKLAIPQLVERGRAHDESLAGRMWGVITEEEDLGLQDADAVEHAAAVLGELARRKFRLGLLTNNRRDGTLDRMTELGLHAYFGAIATRDDVGVLKPMPDGVTHLLARLDPVQRVYVVGDSWIDGQAASAAGARFIGFGPREAEVRARGITVWTWITDLRELLELDLVG
ncbi:MAG TPA: HAD-IA family hydrolase [bacterium]|jgi:phosphoglycolate phosphatase|nr:HAD-IA family hydrolase [bacterium]